MKQLRRMYAGQKILLLPGWAVRLIGMDFDKVTLSEEFSRFSDHWSPKIVGELNDSAT